MSDVNLTQNDIRFAFINVKERMEKMYGYISDDYLYAKKRRTYNTALAVMDDLQGVSFEDICLHMFAKVDKEMKPFVSKYEFLMEEAKLNPENFLNILDKKLQEIADYIYKKDAWDDFQEFFHFWYVKVIRQMTESKVKKLVISAYMCLMMETVSYLTPKDEEEMLLGGCGDKPIWIKDKFPYSDFGQYPVEDYLYSQMKAKKSKDSNSEIYLSSDLYEKNYRKYGYHITSEGDATALRMASRNYTNTLYGLNYFITENHKEIMDFRPYDVRHIVVMPRKWRNTDFYENAVKQRNYALPSMGVYAEYEYAGEIKRGLFMETCKNETIYLLFKFETDYGDICGWYDTREGDFFCPFTGTNIPDMCEEIKNFVLENYYLLTIKELDYSKKKLSSMIVSDGVSSYSDRYLQQPIVKYSYKNHKVKAGREESVMRHYDRSNYVEMNKDIAGFPRKLPDGQRAGEDKIAYALSLGLILEEGYTFVRPFRKKTYHKIV